MAEEVSITLPANALETLVSSQLIAGGETANGLGAQLLYGATAGRNEIFPCLKKGMWADQVQLRVVHN
jgi:hypothetical protein